ncbi:hypothetical protein, partial [Streptomyces scabiei]|uniref:hypothetical protein n=1 Tax=Streptomyces scabiei TaxID=1930 RepID=UPI0029B7DEB7
FFLSFCVFFFLKENTASDLGVRFVGLEMFIRDSPRRESNGTQKHHTDPTGESNARPVYDD